MGAKAKGFIEDLLQDSELKTMLEENPKLAEIAEEVKKNPMAGMKYMMDPDPTIQKFLSKAMSKLMGGAGGGGLDGLLGGAGGVVLDDLLGGAAGIGGQRKPKKAKKKKCSKEL